MLAPGADGSSATEDFGEFIVSDCFIPQIVYSTTFGYRTDIAEWGGATPDSVCAIFDTEDLPGPAVAGASSDCEHGMGADLRWRCD